MKKSAISASIDADLYADDVRLSQRHRMGGGRMTWGTIGHMGAIEMENPAQSQKASPLKRNSRLCAPSQKR
jgi:hypothetical protein